MTTSKINMINFSYLLIICNLINNIWHHPFSYTAFFNLNAELTF